MNVRVVKVLRTYFYVIYGIVFDLTDDCEQLCVCVCVYVRVGLDWAWQEERSAGPWAGNLKKNLYFKLHYLILFDFDTIDSFSDLYLSYFITFIIYNF